ncbi:MAG: CPBP family intramembrane glutamic endopeptidase [Bryobacteraceae bacterium]
MAKTLGSFRAAVPIGWIALGVAGVLYARFKGIPSWAAVPVLAAYLVEYPFYLVPAFPTLRERLAGARLPGFLVASTVLPYLVCCCGAVDFQWIGLVRLAALSLALSLWYLVLPATALADIAFLALIASVMLGRYFDPIYPKPYPGVDATYLGKLALIQIAVMTLTLERRIHETGYGFVPKWHDWRIGALHYLYFVPVGLPLALVIKAVRFAAPAPLWVAAATFLGMLWVVVLFEEFLFRGVLQSWIEEWTWSRKAALVITSVLFGLAHLWFRSFPNWRWVPVATVLGWFCGRARNEAGNIRAGMVTHALVVTTWRVFFA